MNIYLITMTSATYRGILVIGLMLVTLVLRVSGQCDGTTLELTATGPPQYLRTPNYPADYPADPAGCSWWITNDNSKSIVFNVEDIFTHNCTTDYLDVYDGESNNDTYLGTFCTDDPVFFVSSGSSLYLEFPTGVSNYRISALFFIADDALKPQCNTTLSNATGEAQYIMSQSLPNPYSTNDDCWYIVYPSTPNYAVGFSVIFVDIYPTEYCVADKMIIYSASLNTSTMMTWYCNEKESYPAIFTEPFEVGGSHVILHFTTDGLDTGHRGYYFSYTQIHTQFEMMYPDDNDTLYMSASEHARGTINYAVGYLLLNFTGTMLYEFTSEDENEYFTLGEDESVSGRYNVEISTAIDYETMQEVTTLLRITSTHMPQLFYHVNIHVNITDEDDNAPTFLNLPNNVSLERTDLTGAYVYQVITNDSDITEDYKNVSYSISPSDDPHGLLSIDSATGEITLANNAEIMPNTNTEYSVRITATSIVGNLESNESLTIIVPLDMPPNCSHAEIYADSLNNNYHEAFMDIAFDEPWSCTDEFEITYSIGTVSPSLVSPLFDIDEQYGDLWIVRKYTEDDLDVTRRFEVEIIATDRILQTTSFLVIINTTMFGCFPNPQILNARMGDPPGTVLKNDFNCTVTTGLSFSIKKQYPSNAFQIQTYPDGTYAVTLLDEVYKIHFYSLILRVTSEEDRITLNFQVIVQTNVCTVEEVNSYG